ncbi:hypothetical protein GE061_009236 [Apolygus lucorum]|uniref:Serine/threonine-protein phosphatase PGAM5, mitochondrial n=1 Tax=Apolygus lucorum TaxID=248454 RepID=A0A6A4K6U0_APOLU|nr:hypothetical protein GE061_008888 [Apolygus lucorum]KAF6214493.1 hypothetical protein GE061_009236 [Apolygus lucorum]
MWSKCRAIVGLGIGVGVGVGLIAYKKHIDVVEAFYAEKPPFPPQPFCVGPENCPITKWDYNWDHRCSDGPVTAFSRNIIMISHGQYNTQGKNDDERGLTELGKKQAEAVAHRLVEYNLPYYFIINSHLKRSEETAAIIRAKLGLKQDHMKWLQEGTPTPPEPSIDGLREPFVFHQDSARIEAAFRKLFYRPGPELKEHRYEIVVCHANIIRFFVCRALQFPPEAWLRWQIPHASITWISIYGSGMVSVNQIGDIGFLPPQTITF